MLFHLLKHQSIWLFSPIYHGVLCHPINHNLLLDLKNTTELSLLNMLQKLNKTVIM